MKCKVILIFIFIFIFISLTGCISNDGTIEETVHNNEIESIKNSYEDNIEDLRLSQAKEIDDLNDIIEKLELELEDVKLKYEKLKRKQDLLDMAMLEENDNNGVNYQDTYIEDKTIRVYSEGTDYLEDGIICNLELLDNNEDIIWHVTWEGLQVTELVTNSPVTVFDNRIYIVISGELNAIDINTGEIIWDSVIVGSSGNAPVVDNDGCIYLTGQYAPYLSAITSNGIMKWQIESEDMYGISKVTVTDEYLLIKRFDDVILFDKDGQKIEQ